MRVLKQSTQIVVLIGPFLDKTDGVTEEAGLAGAATEISKAGASFGAGPTLGTLDSDGWYPITLTTTHTNTLGDLTVKVHDAATHLPVWAHFTVIPANAFDALVNGTGVGVRADVQGWLGTAPATPTVNGVPEVDMTHLGGVAQSATDLKDFADTGYDPVAHKVAGVVLTDTLTTYTGNTVQTGDSFARIGLLGAGLTDLGGMSTTMKGQVQTEAEDALVTHRLDELLNADSDIDGAAPPTVGSVFHELMSKTAGSFTFDQLTDSLEALRDRGDAAWITAVGFSTHTAADVWAVATRLLTAGTNIVLAKGVGVTGFNDLSAAQVNTEADTALADYDGPTNAEMVAAFTEIKGATWSAVTDTLEAIRDRGDAAWTTAVGFSTHTAADVWAVATRLLTAGTNIVLAKGVGVTGFNDLSSADVTAAVPSAATIASTVWASTMEGTRTAIQFMRGFAAALLGKVSGGGTSPEVFRDIDDTKNRISATNDASGNRTAITLDLT